MIIYNVLRAAPSIQKLVSQPLPLRTSYRLSKMVRNVNEELDFFKAKEAELKAKHEYKVPVQEYNELLNLEIDWEEPKIEIPLDENICLSVADIEALTPFIEFKEVELNAEN